MGTWRRADRPPWTARTPPPAAEVMAARKGRRRAGVMFGMLGGWCLTFMYGIITQARIERKVFIHQRT